MHSVNKSHFASFEYMRDSLESYRCVCLYLEARSGTSRHFISTIFSQKNISSSSSASTSAPANEMIPNPGRRSFTTTAPCSSLETTRERNNSVSGVSVVGLMPSSYATQGVALQRKLEIGRTCHPTTEPTGSGSVALFPNTGAVAHNFSSAA